MWAQLRSWMKAALVRGRMEDDMAREMESHIAHRAQDLMSRGVPPAEAERRARVEFGGRETYKEECRQALGLRLLDELRRNTRFALRQLRKTPAFALTAVLTLALCIGANAVIFSLVDTLLLRPLPYPEPERLAQVVLHVRGQRGEGLMEAHNGAAFELLRDQAVVIQVAAEGSGGGVSLAAGGRVENVQQRRVSAGYFSVLGVAPLMGREFNTAEDQTGGAAVVVLSHALWKRVFQGDASALDKPVMLRGEPHTVIGVMPESFRPMGRADVWTPLRPSRTGEGGGSNYNVIARLRPGVTWAQALAGLEPLSQQAREAHQLSPQVTPRLGLRSLQEGASSGVRQILFILWAAVGTVLLIGCVNIAGLLLARAARRRREIGTRLALGGGRGALVRQLLTESVVLAAIGGALGVVLAYAGLQALAPYLEPGLGIDEPVQIDVRVLGASVALTLLTSLVFGLFPAWHASRADIRTVLIESGGHGVAGVRSHWPRRLLLAFEVALGVLLLNGAAQFTRTFLHLAGMSPGFDGKGVFTASLSLQDARYKESAPVNALFDESLRRIRALPGVTNAAVALTLPYQRALNMGFLVLDGPNASEQGETTNMTYVTPQYFETLRIPLLRGRLLGESDGATAPLVAVVNASFVQEFLKNQEPVGTRIRSGGRAIEIVGVVGDVLQRPGWGNYGPLEEIPGVFVPAAQATGGFFQLVHTWFRPHWMVRASGSPDGLVAGMQSALAGADPLLPFSGFRTMDEVRSFALAQYRFQALLVNGFGALGLLLSAIGIGGLTASSVAERWREMGVRIALGASLGRAIRTLAAPGIVLTLAGLAAGSALSYPALKAIQKLVWGIQPADPLNFMVAGAVLLAAALAASFLPAVRLRRLNVADTLREG
jgi:predicted permease